MKPVYPWGPTDPVAEEMPGHRAPARTPRALAEAARALRGRRVWHVNTTALGGGVAELLRVTVPHHNAAGIESRWLVTRGTPEFFTLTKQLHHLLHGMPGNGRTPSSADATVYAELTAKQAEAMVPAMEARDIAVLHDPQTIGLAPALRRAGLHVIWRSHIGTHRPSPLAAAGWRFLAPYADHVDQFVFSSPRYVPAELRDRTVAIVPPAIDPDADKCRPMTPEQVSATLTGAGLYERNGSPGRTAIRVLQDRPLPRDAQVVLQLSRWDPLKDMDGVLAAFAEHIAPATAAHLVLAGPDPDEVADDIENRTVLDGVIDGYSRLPETVRRRVHLLILPMADRQANALMVNALQRRATVVAQKSLEEGFGLAVTEAMHKRRPVVAAAVGGILDQVTDREHGLLVPPADGAAFGAAVRELLGDSALSARLGAAAGRHCDRTFVVDREHERYADLFLRAVAAREQR